MPVNSVSIRVAYPGAAPKDIEQNITIRIEEALKSIQGIELVVTYSRRNSFYAWIRIEDNYNLQEVMDEIKVQVDGIASFPAGMEKPIITANKYQQEVLYISLYGDLDDKYLKALGEEIYREIQAIPIVSVSDYYSGLPYEMHIEIAKDKLREYNLSIQQVAETIRAHSINMSAGQIKAKDGYVTLRAENQAYRGLDFAQIPIVSRPDGSQILLADIAVIDDGFADGIQYSKFNGQNAKMFFIGASENQSITDVAKVVGEYVDKKNAALPDGLH